MGRPRKNARAKDEKFPPFSEENEEFSEEESAEDDGPPAVARQSHRIVTTFLKEVPVDELEGTPQHLVVEEEPATTREERAPLPDDVATLLAETGAGKDRFQLKVWRLPNYRKDGLTNSTARVYCATMDFTPDYEAVIQANWGSRGGDFKVDVIRNGKPLPGGSLPVFSCEPLASAEAADAPPAPPLPPYPYGYVMEAEPQERLPLKAQLREMVELKTLMDSLFPRAEPAQNPAPVSSDPDTALLSFLAKDPDVIDRVAKGTLGKLLGESRDENPWADVAMEALKSGQAVALLNTGINALFNGLRSMAPQPQPIVAPPAPAPMAETPPLPEDAPAMIPATSPEERVLSLAVEHCLASRPAAVAAARILAIADQINDQAPEYSIDAYLQMFVAMTPDQAIEFAAQFDARGPLLREMPTAAEWVSELQAAIGAQLNAEGEE